MSVGANFVYSFIINYLLFALLGHSFLFKIKGHKRTLLLLNLLFLGASVVSLLFMVMLSWYIEPFFRVMIFFAYVSLMFLLFFFLFMKHSQFKRYDMPEDFLIYPYASIIVIGALFLLQSEGQLSLMHALMHGVIGVPALWLAAAMTVMMEERFILTPTAVGVQDKMRVIVSAVIFYVILVVLMG